MRSVLLLLLSAGLNAHALHHELFQEGRVYGVQLHFASENDFSYENYEVFAPGSEIPFALGRTDAKGRLFFMPDRNGSWQVKAFSEDGHGSVIDIKVGETVATAPSRMSESPLGLFWRLILGVGAIGGIYALVHLFITRREHEKTS